LNDFKKEVKADMIEFKKEIKVDIAEFKEVINNKIEILVTNKNFIVS